MGYTQSPLGSEPPIAATATYDRANIQNLPYYSPEPQKLPSRVYLRVGKADESDLGFKKAMNLLEIFCDGGCEVIFYDRSISKYIKVNSPRLMATPFVISELEKLLGKENVAAKT